MYVVLMFSPIDEKTTLRAGRESYGHTVQSVYVAARSIDRYRKQSLQEYKNALCIIACLPVFLVILPIYLLNNFSRDWKYSSKTELNSAPSYPTSESTAVFNYSH